MASRLLEHMGDYYRQRRVRGLSRRGWTMPHGDTHSMQGGCPLRIPCASPAQCSGVRTGVGARHGEPVGDHSDGGNFVGYHNTAGLRVGRGQPVRVTNRDADHAGVRGRKVGVPFRTLPQGGCPLPKTCGRKVGVPKVGVPFRTLPQGGCPLPQGGCPLPKTCGRKVGVPKVGVPFRTLPQGGCPLPQGGCPLPKTCGRKVGVPKVGVPFRKNLLILRMILV